VSITVVENFLTSKECAWWINFHKTHYSEFGEEFFDTNILDLQDTVLSMCNNNKRDLTDPIKLINARIAAHIISIDPCVFPNYSRVVHWPEQSRQARHIDLNFHPYTSIIYLNDDFEGGHTHISGTDITPKTGKIITFKGNEMYHEVSPVTQGNRWTIATWYKRFQFFEINKLNSGK
jgi:2OG-Fe(II) oxygenase superfamily